MREMLQGFLARKAFILLSVAILAAVTIAGLAVVTLDRNYYLSNVRREVEQGLYAETERVQARFFEAVLVAKSVESILLQSDGVVDGRISRLINEYQRHNLGILVVGLAPGLEVTHLFPQDEGQEAVGLQYSQVPSQMASVAKAFRTRSPVVAGPVSLVQGGQGYILRYPVFLPDVRLNADQFWGVVSIVMGADGLFGTEGPDFGHETDYAFSLTKRSSSDVSAMSEAFPPPSAAGDAVSVEFKMLGNQWIAEAEPVDGWPLYSPQGPYFLGFFLLSKIALIGGLLAYRRLAETKERAYALLAEAVGGIDEGFISFDKDERLVIVNKTYLDYHSDIADRIVPGMTMEDRLRLDVADHEDVHDPDEIERLIADRLSRFRNPGEPFLQEMKDDVWLKVTETKTPHGYTVGIWTDVSVEKRAQQAAEEADKEKTEFLNNVSHELRTPLTVIYGRAVFLQNNEKLRQTKRVEAALAAQENLSDELRDAVAAQSEFTSEQGAGIADSAKHMIRLVEDLLEWTKVARGTLKLDMAMHRVDQIAESVVEELRPNAEKKNLSLTFEGDGFAEAMADKVRLKQILYNLVNNAVKFTDRGSITLSMHKQPGQIVFSVADTGRGISSENLEKVFNRFHQVDGSMVRENGGLGLGLAISQQLALLHNGSLSLESTFGKGSTFRLVLPTPHTAERDPVKSEY